MYELSLERGRAVLRASLTIDVERRMNVYNFDGIYSDVSKLLDFLRPICRATFFVTGEIAEKQPWIPQEIKNDGHEVACHGLHHERLDTYSFGEQLRRIEQATRFLERAISNRPLGFRAPENRANTNTLLALEKLQYVYDSSVLSGTLFLRPEPHKKWRFILAPQEPYFPSRTQLTRRGDCRVLELPCSSFILPFTSKLTMRSTFASDSLAAILVRRARRKQTPVTYCLHSYDSHLSFGDLSWLERAVHTLRRLGVSFITMSDLALAIGRRQSFRKGEEDGKVAQHTLMAL